MKISIFQRVVCSFNIFRTFNCSSKIIPKWSVIPFTQAGEQIEPSSKRVSLIKSSATLVFLKLQNLRVNFIKFNSIPTLTAIKTFQSQLPNT